MAKVINIASLRKPAPVVIETEDGTKHEMIPTSVGDFLTNLKEVEDLGVNASPIQEAQLILNAVSRSFPTLPRAELETWPLDIVRNVYVSVIIANGEHVADSPEKLEEAKSSGKSAPEV